MLLDSLDGKIGGVMNRGNLRRHHCHVKIVESVRPGSVFRVAFIIEMHEMKQVYRRRYNNHQIQSCDLS